MFLPLHEQYASTRGREDDHQSDLEKIFVALKQHKDYSKLRNALKGSIGSIVLPTILPIISIKSPELAKIIKSDKAAFLKMINEDHMRSI